MLNIPIRFARLSDLVDIRGHNLLIQIHMKIVAINGSPHRNGNTAQALKLIGDMLQLDGIEFELVNIGHKNIHGCTACGYCIREQNECCVFKDDVNEIVQKMKIADGVMISSPVYFSGVAGTMKSFLDRAFYVSSVNGNLFRHKVGAAIVAVRRSGGSATLDALNHYLNYSEMLVASSNYWNIIHGHKGGELLEDDEGLQILRVLARNIAYMLKIHAASSIIPPEAELKILTNFVRKDGESEFNHHE